MAYWSVKIEFSWSSSMTLPWTRCEEKNLSSLRLQLHLTLPFFFTNHYWKVNSNPATWYLQSFGSLFIFWSLKNFYGFLRSYMGPKSNLHPDTEISSMVLLTAKSSILRYIIWWYTVTAHCSNPLAKIFLAHNVLAEIRFESCPFLPPLFRKLWDTR